MTSTEYLTITMIVILANGFMEFIKSYFSKKGENLATKQDIEGIKNIEEQIKTNYQLILEHQSYKNQLKLAALDKRLDVHQEAYIKWRELIQSASKDHKTAYGVARECQIFWVNNNLYLDSKVREAFPKGLVAAFQHADLLNTPDKGEGEKELMNKHYKTLEDLGELIVKAVELPSIEPDKHPKSIDLEEKE